MNIDKKNELANLKKKASAIFGAALAALTGIQANATMPSKFDNLESKIIQFKEIGKVKPMPVLKLNPNNLENSILAGIHSSHSSHSSHRSHNSHRSHYSHRSGAMFV